MAEIQFQRAELSEIERPVREHLASLPSRIDSFLEDHILRSNHYRIAIDGAPAGFASIHESTLLTQFHLIDRFKARGQEAFARLRFLEDARTAFVPTCDEFFLSHALDEYRELDKQAYFFSAGDRVGRPDANVFSFRAAGRDEIDLIAQEAGEFFDEVARRVDSGELFVTMRSDDIAGFGLMERSTLYDRVASIGMFTIERFRRSGVGTATISYLIAECRRSGIEPVAGCWYRNHNSKRTLERAGMHSATRLLRIEF